MSDEPLRHTIGSDPAQADSLSFVGHIDQLSSFWLTGWLYTADIASLDKTSLDIYFRDTFVRSINISYVRDDLASFFGRTRVGFHCDLSVIKYSIIQLVSQLDDYDKIFAAITKAIDVKIANTDLWLPKTIFVVGPPFTSTPEDASAQDGLNGPFLGELAWQFDRDFYLRTQLDINRIDVDPLQHYRQFGEREGRRPNQFFDPRFYNDIYADIRNSDGNALEHYYKYGRFEGRLPAQTLATKPRRKRAILFVGHDAYAAGAQRVLLDTTKWFSRHTFFDVLILLLGQGHLVEDYSSIGRCFVTENADADSALIIERLLGNVVPEVVYCNTVVTGKIFYSKIGAYLKDSKIIAHCHEMTSVLREFPRETSAMIERADHWLCASGSIQSHLSSEFGVPLAKTSVVWPSIQPNIIGDDELASLRLSIRREFGVLDSEFIVMGCGTVYPRKGPDIFCDVGKHVIDSFKDKSVRFIWIGEGEDKDRLETVVLSNGLEGKIQFVGFRRDASELLSAADVLFLPSREDPFPLVVLEAAWFGIPCLCFSDGVGIADFVAADRGVVLQDRQVVAAAVALVDLLLDEHRRKRLGENARAAVQARHIAFDSLRAVLQSIYNLGVHPAVSVIVPNYNHERFLGPRLRSILDQTIQDFQLIVLDDCSTDNSVDLIDSLNQEARFQLTINKANSGSVFSQWRLGMQMADAEIIWVAESDDFCDLDFIEKLYPSMEHPDINLAFAKTEVVDEFGDRVSGALDDYMRRFSPEFGSVDFVKPGARFVNDGFGALCVIVNVSACLLRKRIVENALLSMLDFKMCGDWRLYLECCLQGSIAYISSCNNYFRRHINSVVHKIEGSDQYFSERIAIADFVVSRFWTTPVLHRRIQAEMYREIGRFSGRFSGSFDGTCTEIFARGRARTYVDNRLHVCFYVHGLLVSKGGIERLFSLVSGALIDRGYRVSVVCRPSDDLKPVYSLRHDVNVIPIDITEVEGAARLRAHLVATFVDVFVPMLSEQLFEIVIAAAEGLAIPIVASEHNDPWVIEERWWNSAGRARAFSKCSVIHLLIDRFRTSLPNELRSRSRIIPNPVTPGFFGLPKIKGVRKRIVAVGRLAPQKQFDLLIDAFSLIYREFSEWDLWIFGEGELRRELEAVVVSQGIEDRVFMPGESEVLEREMQSSDIIAMPSEFEGFGMALAEGMAAGLPGIAFAHCNGPNEIIRHGENGILVQGKTAEAFARSLNTLMDDEELRSRLGAAARAVALRYDVRSVVDAWEEMIVVDCKLQ